MIKINFLKNCFGIKELLKPELIDGNTIIYSPNGTMKSSFADCFHNIFNRITVQDEINNIPAIFEFIDNGKKIDQVNFYSENTNILVFGKDFMQKEISSNISIAELVLDNKTKLKYDSLKNKYSSIYSSIELDVALSVLRSSQSGDGKALIVKMFPSETYEESIIKMLSSIEKKSALEFEGINYSDVFNPRNDNILNNPEIQKIWRENHEQINKTVNIKINENLFNHNFTLSNLIKVSANAKKEKYFDAGHKMTIDNVQYGFDEIQDLITSETKKIYGSEELKEPISDVINSLNKNAGTRKLKTLIDSQPEILKEFSSLNEFGIALFAFKMFPIIDKIKASIGEVKNIKAEITSIIDESKKENESTFDKIINEYNSRFFTVGFKVKISNRSDSILGLSLPVFILTDEKGTQIINKNRLSSSEKRCYAILNLIFNIETMKKTPFTLILDDPVDSFDYKNKYAFVKYIWDLLGTTSIQTIILTHNFDFYRSCRLLKRGLINKKLFAYKNKNHIELIECNDDIFDGYKYFNRWKTQQDIASSLGLLPVVRNLYDLLDKDDPNYLLLLNTLHYGPLLGNIICSKIWSAYKQIFEKVDLRDFNNSDLFINVLHKETVMITSNTLRETDLKSKIIIAVFLRFFHEYYLFNLYKKQMGHDFNFNVQQTGSFSPITINDVTLSADDKSLFESITLIASPFVHLNGFMYEPLVDVGTEYILDMTRKLLNLVKNNFPI